MNLFFHDVGLKGSKKDFPKTILSTVSIKKIIEHVPSALKVEVSKCLELEFPDGYCNAWGVPKGAVSIIKSLNVDDAMLLIRTTGGEGDIPALCIVKGFWREEMPELSKFFWDSDHYPFIFFFKTQGIHLTWSQLKQDVGYKMNFRPSGNVYRVKDADEKLFDFGGVKGYIRFLTKSLEINSPISEYRIDNPVHKIEYEEGERRFRESAYFKRNPRLVRDAKKLYGYSCQACGFDFKKIYGDLGSGYIECHHLNPLSEREENYNSSVEDVCVLCSNCHRMIHRSQPPLTLDQLKGKLNIS